MLGTSNSDVRSYDELTCMVVTCHAAFLPDAAEMTFI